MQRESFRSRLGFLLVSAGCAIGIGNVWRFPYIAGLYGGGLFVLIYLICLLVMGVPVLTMELAVGRASKKSAVLAYKALESKGSKWHIHGWFCLLGCVMLMMYYTTSESSSSARSMPEWTPRLPAACLEACFPSPEEWRSGRRSS